HHVVLVPTYKESEEILAETLECVATQTVPSEQIAVVLAFEERDPEASARAAHLTERFAHRFGEWLVTLHPDLPGEVKGKSSNLAWAARRTEAELIDSGRLDARNLLVTVCDADSRLDRQYLAALGYKVLSHRDGRLHVYQPVILFYANHARLPLLLRPVSSVFSLYSLSRLAASHRLVPQSTYSLTWWAARQVGFWDVDVVPEDSHMFFKVWLHFGRRVRARAIHLPVYADAAEGVTARGTLVSTYQQIRRWAWGVSDIPYVALRGLRARHIPWPIRVARIGWYTEEHLVWPSHWFLLTLGGLVPPLLNPAYAATAQAIWQSSAMSTFLSLCLPSLLLGIVVDAVLKRRSPNAGGLLEALYGVTGFFLLPLTGLAMVALPALDAHTRLLFGRSLAHEVTEKLPSSAVRPAGFQASRSPARSLHTPARLA
ncbi:MAG TPA: glycosyltransferase family 2 protein, partial [Chloroflexota bacterium]|nr:glycosyltransferase family 2 protein [Chloroflexota bacterium]